MLPLPAFMKMNLNYDIIIVGGGPIGIACAIAAKRAAFNYLVLEKGCLVNSLYNYPVNMTFFSTSERLEIAGVPFVSNNVKPTRAEALEYYRRVTVSNNINIRLQETVTSINSRDKETYTVETMKNRYACKFVIIATGFYDVPVMMNIPGEHMSKVSHYYKDPHYYAMQNVVIVGANNSAVDAALETFRKGASVTMIIRGSEIGPRVKYWVRPDIENRIREGSIKAFFNATLHEIREKEVDIHTEKGIVTIQNDFVIAMTGYKPNFDFLKKIGIKLSPDEMMKPDYDPITMESNLPNVYLAGVVCGGMNTHVWFIENSREHADRIIEAIQAK